MKTEKIKRTKNIITIGLVSALVLCTMAVVPVMAQEIVWQYDALVPWDSERLTSGNTLITEFGNHTVIEVTPTTKEIIYGTGIAGSGLGELNSPVDAERLDSGNTLIIDRNNHRVIEVNPTGGIVWQYGTTGVSGNGTNELYNPMDAERLTSGNTLIADRLNNRVIEVYSTGAIVWQMTGLNHPFDADRLSSGNTLIVEYKNHRVIEITPAGKIVWQYGTGTPGSGVNELNFPTDAERLPDGDTLIVDAMNDRVIEIRTSDYDPARVNNGFITRSIVWKYESNYPADVERLSNGNTLIAEAGNNRVIEVVTPPAEPEPSTPFLIFGEVNYDTGEPVLNLNVTVENMDTTGDFYVEIHDNFYQVSTVSGRVLANDTLHFTASNDNTTEFDYTVTPEDMNHGGFVQNITIVHPPVWIPDLTVTAINVYHNNTDCPAWFNLSNEINITVENIGTLPAGTSNVSLYIEDVFFGKLPVPSLSAGASTTVTFENWMPIGEDCLQPPCDFEWSYRDYNLTAVADCDSDVDESDETNNEATVVDRACYNGYMADEPLENVVHGMLHGGLLFTTGDGRYTGLYSVGSTQTTNYDITLPAGAAVKFAHLNVYYTWNKPRGTCPEMEVCITTPGGTAYTLPLMKAYNDIKCTCPGATWVLPFGNYVYNVSDYITESGTYTVTVKNVCAACDYFCPAAPGIVLVYEDANAPLIEYWINEGADVLMGGRRYPTSSNLAWWENINNATFQASTGTLNVTNATLGVIAPWAGSSWEPGSTNYLFFNGIKLGTGAYLDEPYLETMGGITMHIGAGNAQVGVNVTDVTALYLNASDNVVGQCDDGDNMMPANAFLVVEYEKVEVPPMPDLTVTEKNETLLEDGTFTVTYTVANIGDGNAGASNTTIYIDGVPEKEDSVPALAAGESCTNTVCPFYCRYNQTLNITVCADNNDVVDESAEGNNCLSNELVCPERMLASVKIEPGTLKAGQWITTYIELPKGYDVYDIDIETVLLNGVVPAENDPKYGFVRDPESRIGDYDNDGILDCMVKFNRSDVLDMLDAESEYVLTVTGELTDGTEFEGSVIPDTEPPYMVGHDPAPGAVEIPHDTNITVHVKDDGFGVDLSDIEMEINGMQVTPDITGDKYDYKLTYDPPTNFSWGQVVNVKIEASDLAKPNNVMHEDYSFTVKVRWISDNAIVAGLPSYYRSFRSTVFYKDGTWYLIAGRVWDFIGYKWTGSAWTSDSAIVSGLPNIGQDPTPSTVFNKEGTWYLIAGEDSGEFNGFNWTGSAWQSDPAIVSGLEVECLRSFPKVFNKDGTWYLISGFAYGHIISGYNWTGSAWQSDPAIVSGLEAASTQRYIQPTVFCKDKTWYVIAYNHPKNYGFKWTGSAWHPDSEIVSGLPDHRTTPTVFNKDGTWYLISGEYGVFHGFRWQES